MNDFSMRVCFVLIFGCVGYFLKPVAIANPIVNGVAGLLLGMGIVLFEIRLRQVSLKRLIGAVIGSTLGILGAFLISLVLDHPSRVVPGSERTFEFLQIGILVLMAYVGMALGASKGEMLNLTALGGLVGGGEPARNNFKILDTSVIIDGRIADVAETHFLDGALVIPQFVLRELQLVANSTDSMKRTRGRRGLDVLQRIQKMPQLTVRIVEEDFPNVRDVDMKLIELAKVYGCKIVTNDFNLNKVAQLHGLEILNINDLANALKPIVLPGETMRVLIIREGKESTQGVAYLDDGTMVVVDNARQVISKTIDITVTSVLQTAAGQMIFGRFDQRLHGVHEDAPARVQRPDRAPNGQSVASIRLSSQ